MSNTQMSLEKKKSIMMWISFIACQFSIIFFGVMVGLWIVYIMRQNEIDTNPQITTVFNCSIAFTVLTVLAITTCVVTYILYIKYRNALDGVIDQSFKSVVSNNEQQKQNININLNAPVQQPVAQVKPPVQNGPVKKVVTTTTTTTSSKPGTVVRTVNQMPAGGVKQASAPATAPRPAGAAKMPPRPGMPPRPAGAAPMPPRPGMPPRPAGAAPMPPRPGMPPRPAGAAPMPPRPGMPVKN